MNPVYPASERELTPWGEWGISENEALASAGGCLRLPFSAPACPDQVFWGLVGDR